MKLFDLLKIIDDKTFYAAMIKKIVEDEKTEEKIEKRLETEYTKKELQLMKEAMEEAARDGYPVTNQPVFFRYDNTKESVMYRDEELLSAAGWLDGYLKVNRANIDLVTQESMYIAIRELVNNISEPYKKEKADVIKVLISTKEDWKRFLQPYE